MRNYISPIISEKKPEFIKREFKNFSRFIDHFYTFLELDGNPLEILETFYENCETNNQVDQYIDKILLECGFDIQNTLKIPKKELILHLRDFYLSIGSEESFKFLFKILYNCDLSIDYPRKRMLIPSQAVYSGRYFIFTTTHNYGSSNFNTLLGLANSYDLTLKGISSKTECAIESISILHRLNLNYLKIQIDTPYREFQKGEGIEITSLSTGIKIVENFVDTINLEVNEPGKGYKVGDTITISNSQVLGSARVKTLKDGSISSITVNSGGTGYAVGDQILSDPKSKGHSFSAVVSKVNNSGNYLSVPFNSSLDLSSGDFCIETWLYMPFSNIDSVICSGKNPNSNTGWDFKINGNRNLLFTMYGVSSQIVSSTKIIQSNKWTHIAATREGNSLRLFIDGVLSSNKTISSGISASSPIKIGIDANNKYPFIGNLDNFRITKGNARYTSNFIPPDEINNSDSLFANVSLLIDFNGIDNSQSILDLSNLNNTIGVNGSISLSSNIIRTTNTSGYFSGLGSIEKVSIYNKGYGYDTIPTIIVKSQKGTGAILIADSENIGQIESIEIIDPFIDSVGIMVSSVNSLNGTGAIIDAVSKSVFLERPSWKSLEGTLGINSTLLDSYYYQQFSYTIYSPITRSNYDSLVDEWVHPSGFVRFSILDISYSNDLNQNGFIDTFYLTTIKVIEGIIGVYMINFESNGYSSIAPSILPLTKYQTSQDKSLLINPLSNLNWFKESINNFKFLASEWDNFICGDIPSNTYPERKKINDNSILMNQTLDAQINIITI